MDGLLSVYRITLVQQKIKLKKAPSDKNQAGHLRGEKTTFSRILQGIHGFDQSPIRLVAQFQNHVDICQRI